MLRTRVPGGRIRATRRTLAALAVMALTAVGCVPAPEPAPPVGPPYEPVATGPSAGCAATSALPSTPTVWTIQMGPAPRRATLRLPAGATPGTPLPLLVSLHPFAADAPGWEAYSGLAKAATARGYAVLTPQGLPFAGAAPRWTVRGGFGDGPDDVAFLDQLLDRAGTDLCLDLGRVYAAGFSAGAAFAHTLSCALPHRFAAVAGSGGMNLSAPCSEGAPISALLLHGTADPIVPPSGSTTAPPLNLSIDAVAASLATRAACTGAPATSTPWPGVTRRTFTGCGAEHVEDVRIAGMGHTWAGSLQFSIISGLVGPSIASPDANALVLDFLATRAR